jgi:hypothetical protein
VVQREWKRDGGLSSRGSKLRDMLRVETADLENFFACMCICAFVCAYVCACVCL